MVKISGIYAYYDNLKHEIVYVGKDSHIDENRRHKDHYSPSNRDKQVINKVLQNDNTGRYTYVILEKGDFTNDMLNEKEISWISYFNPKFNFTPGGDGVGSGENHPNYGKKHSKETREKMSRSQSGENNPMYGKNHSEEVCEKISRALSGRKFSKEHREKMSENHADFSGENHPMYGKRGKKNPSFDPCIKIRKQKCKTCTQRFHWGARPRTPEKQMNIRRVNLQECIELVEEFINSEKNVYGYTSYEVVE